MATLGRGITNKQAKYLAALCRELKIPYPGRGMSREDASIAIEALALKVEAKRKRTRAKFRAA
jgi:hypothetical protein